MQSVEQARLFNLEDGRTVILDLLDQPRSLAEFGNASYSSYQNHHLEGFVQTHSIASQRYEVEPFPEDLVAGKNTYVYDAHTYHTKVPPQAIECLIKHYAEPGGLVLDAFCGSGMTGVAALRTGRKPILIDLSPAATFIAVNFLTPIDEQRYSQAFEEILAATRDEEMSLYGTHCRTCGKLVPMNYMVWSYGLICEHCEKEFVLWDVAREERKDVRRSKIKTEFDCPHCGKHLKKRFLQRAKLYPVQVGYWCCDSGRRETTAVPDEYDLSVVRILDDRSVSIELWYPTAVLPDGINTRQAKAQGLNSVDALYTTRQLQAMARLWDIARRWTDEEIALKLMFTVTSLYKRVTRLSEFRFWGGSGNIANYNVPMIFNEQNVFQVFERKAKTIRSYLATWHVRPNVPFCISTQSATDMRSIPDNSIDYVFVDPPFGKNINYSEMNFIWEAWLGAFTDTQDEAIINRVQSKSLDEYRELLTQAFSQMYRVLKPGRWLTVMFHSSSAKVWFAIQKALAASSFQITKTQTLDKRHGTFKQFVSPNAVGYDLLLHCRKIAVQVLSDCALSHGTTLQATVREFIERTLGQNPEDFVVHYLHVDRQDEIDSRKLYSLWLKEQLEAGQRVDLGYEQFRSIFAQVIRSESDTKLQ